MYKLKPNPNLAISIDSIPNAIDPNGSVNVEAIDQELKQLPGIQVKDIKLTDLFFPADACTGVYIFYDKGLEYFHDLEEKGFNKINPTDDVAYVGKTSGRSLTERIPSHFAPRQREDYMNIIIKRIAELGSSKLEDSFPVATDFVLKVIYFPIEDVEEEYDTESVKEQIYKVESALIDHYKPYLNKIKGIRVKIAKTKKI